MDVINLYTSLIYLLGLSHMQSTINVNVRLVWLDKVDNLSGLLPIHGPISWVTPSEKGHT
jgi:hypothetical protein